MSVFKAHFIPLDLPLKHTFSISRGSKNVAENVLIRLDSEGISGYGEAAPNYRYGEYRKDVITDFTKKGAEFRAEIRNTDDIEAFTEQAAFRCRSAEAAIEMALIDWLAKAEGLTAAALLNIEQRISPPSSFTIGIDKKEVMQQKIEQAKDAPVFKIKLGTDQDRGMIKSVRELTDTPIRVDVNEGWKSLDQAKREIEFLFSKNVELIEQPMPAGSVEDMEQLKQFSPVPLIADESYSGDSDLTALSDQFHGINIKLMKSGSVLKALKEMKNMKDLGLSVMIGCMIESSLAISAGALPGYEADYVDLDGHLLLHKDVFKGLRMNDRYQILRGEGLGLGVEPDEHIMNQITSK